MARYFSFDLLNKPFADPYQDFAWSKTFHDQLLEKASKIVPPEGSGVKFSNILLIGGASSGKSAFINSVATVSEGEKVNIATTAGAFDHVTTVYRKLEAKGGELQNYAFADVKGLYSAGIDVLMKLIDGHIKEGLEFTDDVSVEEDNEYYNKAPNASDKFQCVAFVFNCAFDPTPTEELVKNIKKFSELLHKKGIPRIALLTHIDEECQKVRSDIRNTFYSKKIKQKMAKYATVTGIPEGLFYPIKNYEAVRYPDPMTSIPILLAIEACLRSATGYLRQQLPSSSQRDANSRERDA